MSRTLRNSQPLLASGVRDIWFRPIAQHKMGYHIDIYKFTVL
jgi:hypothetical protein